LVDRRLVAGTSIHLPGETRVSTKSFQRIGVAGVAALTVVGLLSGCAAKKKTTSTAAAAGSSSTAAAGAAAPSSAAAVVEPSTTPTKVVATGGGKFCQQVADSVNNQAEKDAALGASGTDSLKQSVEDFKSLEGSVLKSAPNAIKPDLVTLFGALDQFYSALAAANYDFTKISPSVEAPLQAPAVVAAEQNVDNYLKNTCGIDTGDDDASAGAAAEASASAALASALAKLTGSPSS
jgi:hypothetical protein